MLLAEVLVDIAGGVEVARVLMFLAEVFVDMAGVVELALVLTLLHEVLVAVVGVVEASPRIRCLGEPARRWCVPRFRDSDSIAEVCPGVASLHQSSGNQPVAGVCPASGTQTQPLGCALASS